MMKTMYDIRKPIAVLCVILMSGLVAADCGTCGSGAKGEKKACPAGCQKACCAKTASGVALGAAAPDFTAKDINGDDVQLSTFKGKIVVLEWINYDCPFVKHHYAANVMTMSTLAKKYADQDVVWLTVNSTHYATTQSNKEWAKTHNLTQTIVVDRDGTVGKLYAAKTTPHMFIIDKEGKLAYQGAIDNAPMGKARNDAEVVNYVDKALSELVGGASVSVPRTKPYGCSVKYPPKQK